MTQRIFLLMWPTKLSKKNRVVQKSNLTHFTSLDIAFVI